MKPLLPGGVVRSVFSFGRSLQPTPRRGSCSSNPGPTSHPYSAECVQGEFCELRHNGALGSWLRGSAGGRMLVVEREILLSLKRKRLSLPHLRTGVRVNHPQTIARVFGVLFLIT